jgi:hypothetical protein
MQILINMIRPFVKISEQDLQIAEEFFENEKHFNEFLVNVFKYYRGRNIQIKTKIVLKYFNSYKKTMNFVMGAAKSGKEGGLKKAENQTVNSDTLQGYYDNPNSTPNDTLVANKKVISNKQKVVSYKEKKINIISEFDKQIRSEGKQFFLNCYQSKTGSDFYWEAKDAVALTKLLDKIKAKVREKFPEIENESAEFKEKLTSGLQIILTNIKDKWILDNYSLPLINSKFNEIYSQITTKKHDTNNLTDLINFAVGANQ